MAATLDGGLFSTVLGAAIDLRQGAAQPVIFGGAFATFFDYHVHLGNLGAPPAPPAVLLSLAPGLPSAVVRAA